MELEFQIIYIFEKIGLRGPHLIARILNKNETFKLTENLTLGGYRVKRFGMPRSVDEDGNPRYDYFTFELKDKSEIVHFEKGQIVKLVE